MPNIYLASLGCDKNRVDGETMIGTLRSAGYAVVNDPSLAAAIVVNTCGFIRDAVEESINLILELAEYKHEGECKALVVVGCMAERYRDEIQKSIPETDVIIGVGQYENIAEVMHGLVGAPSHKPENSGLARIAARADDATPHIAYVKIAEGCDNHCTYCTIPSIRGPYRSRTMEDIIEESRQLIAAGAREIVLVAQDTTLYGTDIYGEKKLPELLRNLAKLKDIIWIRLMYAYPEHITDELINTMAELPQVCKYIDMPIQHSENIILRAMGRGSFSKKELIAKIQALRERMPRITIRTTVIVGFPGEGTREFERLCTFVKTMEFERLGVFPYSQEEGTPASVMPAQKLENTKLARMEKLMELQQRIHFDKQSNIIGDKVNVIVDSRGDNAGEYVGRTQRDAYEVDSVVFFSSENELAPGDLCRVKITKRDQYDLRGVAIAT